MKSTKEITYKMINTPKLKFSSTEVYTFKFEWGEKIES